MKKLISCPKCHKNNIVIRRDYFANSNHDEKSYLIYCYNCHEGTMYYNDEEQAIEAWNNLSLKSFLDDVEDHMVENSFDSIIAVKKFDDETYGYRFPCDNYMTTKQLLLGLIDEICSIKNRYTDKELFTKEELCNWIKEGQNGR